MTQALSNILIIKPSSLGDVVHTLPSVRLLKKAMPGASLRWIVNTEWMPLLAGNPDLAEIIEFPRSQFRRLASTPALTAWLGHLRRLRPDLALDFQGLFRSAVFARLSGARAVHCLSNAEFINRLSATRVVPMRRDEHAVERYVRLVADLGVPVDVPLEFPLSPGERPPGVDANAPYLLLHPFSRGEGKSLQPGIVYGVCAALSGVRIVIAGRASVDLDAPANAINLLNRTSLTELIWLIRHARFTVSVDSGPMHMAAAISSNLLSIHNWTDPRLVGPYNPEAWIWKAGEIFQRKALTTTRATALSEFGPSHLPALVDFLRRVWARLEAGE